MKLNEIPDTDEPAPAARPKKKACIDCGKSLKSNAKLRCRECWTKAKLGRPYIYNPGTVPHEPDICNWHAQDERFCAAMKRAVEAGLERPPGMKISKIFGTANPIFYDIARDVPIRSAEVW